MNLRDIFSLAPIDQILVETDSPYLAPPPHRGKRNEPAYVALTAQKGAEIFNLSYEDFAEQLERNFEKLFSKAKIIGLLRDGGICLLLFWLWIIRWCSTFGWKLG